MFEYKKMFIGLWLLTSASLLHAASASGQQLALDSSKGNCHACHQLPGSENHGNIGPALTNISEKFPDIKQLQSFISDPALTHANTIMPPYGRHRILSEEEIIKISKFIHPL